MNTKEKIIETLEGERAKRVWELIEKAVRKIYGKHQPPIPKETKEEYFSHDDIINDGCYRYLVIEYYNLDEGFYFHYHKEGRDMGEMYDEYFSDCGGGMGGILLVDMEEMKCYLLDKEISYNKKEVNIKNG